MPPATNSGDDPDDLVQLARHASVLADGIEAALGGWVERSVAARWRAWRGGEPPEAVAAAARDAGGAARREVGPRVRELLSADVDEQWANPLALIRSAVAYPTAVLAEAGMPPVHRDEHAERLFPDDRYDLAPATFADLDPALQDRGVAWGAAKAHVVLARRRRDGRR